jgi:acid phosphatase
MRPLALVTILVAAAGCAASSRTPVAPAPPAASPAPVACDERLGALLWFQTSAEYRILAESTYAAARRALDEALADPAWSAATEQSGDFAALPPAVIVDVDETVLDNSPHEAESVRLGRRHPEGWGAWVESAQAEAIPGAVDFVNYAAGRGVVTYYVTNRNSGQEAATRRNLVAVGFPVDESAERLMMQDERPEWSSDKSSRRAEVAKRHRVLLLVGDDMNDFTNGRALPPERRAIAARHANRWGRSWFLLPNPDYGSWERALFGNERGLSQEEILRRKLEHLRLPK